MGLGDKVSLVSIVLPTFNRLQYLRPALDSIFAQTWTDWNLVIADDGSDDVTRAFLRGLERRERVQVVWLAHRGFPSAVRNAALREATGEYVAFLDSDDLWAPRKLELQMAALRERPECQWSYTGFTHVDGATEVIPGIRPRRWRPLQGEIFEQTVTTAAAIRTPTVVATRQLVADLGGFDETLRSCEDYDLWMRLALRSPVALVDEPLVQVRRHESNYSLDWAIAFEGRDRSLDKLQGSVAPRLRPLLLRERAKNGAGLLGEHARRGEAQQVLSALFRTAPYSWRYPEWWWAALRAAARLYVGNRPRP
jgi:glycosyltransferase involved in cell wall biosynthesis